MLIQQEYNKRLECKRQNKLHVAISNENRYKMIKRMKSWGSLLDLPAATQIEDVVSNPGTQF